jgi:hypothetical protein
LTLISFLFCLNESSMLILDRGKEINGKERDCWRDCDFPSECHNFRMEMLRREKEDRLERAKQKAFGAVSSPPANDDIPGLGRERRLRKTNDKELDKMLLDAANAPVFPSIDLDPAISILAGQQGLMGSEVAESQLIVETEKRGQEGEADLGLFPTIDFGGAATHSWLDLDPSFGASDEMTGLVDSEGQVETDFVEKKRRKSIQKIHQLTGSMIGTEDLAMGLGEMEPNSPLKACYTGEGDLGMVDCQQRGEGCSPVMEDVGMGGCGEEAKEGFPPGEKKIGELWRAGNQFLRRLQRGGGGEEVEV